MSLTLAVLAAGIGSRYGGLKQMDPVGPAGEFIIDYSIHDAILAGFDKVVFIIRPEIDNDFRKTIGARVEKRVKVEYVFQELQSCLPRADIYCTGCFEDDLCDFQIPPERKKPWGTGHAVLVCRDVVAEPFGVINADDFYGRRSFEVLASFLRSTAAEPDLYGMVGFMLNNTLSEHGTVARGICRADGTGFLESIKECTKIGRDGDKLSCETPGMELSGTEITSMNMWGFKASVFTRLQREFGVFLKTAAGNSKAEFYISDVTSILLKKHEARVKVLKTESSWFGITYPEDKQTVVDAVQKLIDEKVYPPNLLSLH